MKVLIAALLLLIIFSTLANDTWIVLEYRYTNYAYRMDSYYNIVKVRVDRSLEQSFECHNATATYTMDRFMRVEIQDKVKGLEIDQIREFSFWGRFDVSIFELENRQGFFGQISHGDLRDPKYLKEIPEVKRDGEIVEGFVCSP